MDIVRLVIGLAAAIIAFIVGVVMMWTAPEVISTEWGVGMLLVYVAPGFLDDGKRC